MNNFKNLSDRNLYLMCKKCGAEALKARRKFAGLLPEVYAREHLCREKGGSWLKKRGFLCIYEFAAKLAGMSREQVDLVLRLEKRFFNKPVLHDALVSGEVSPNKLARVVSIATEENQKELLKKVESLSNRALEVFVNNFKNQNGLSEPNTGSESVHVQTFDEDINLDKDIKIELIELKKKGIDVNGLLREFLRERREKIENEKIEIAERQKNGHDDRAIIGMPANRYVPVEVKRIILNEFGTKCSAPGCEKNADNLHHEKIFSIDQCHDPRYIKPLCRGHHELAHAGSGSI